MSDATAVPGLVSTVIPVRNRPKLLREAVASAQAQSYRPIEIVIVDDASSDATPTVIEELVSESGGTVRGLRRPNRGGPGASRETGRLACRGEFVQYLDSDDLLAPWKFEQQVHALHAHPECGLAYGAAEERGVHGGRRTASGRANPPRMERAFPLMLVDRVWHTVAPLYRRSLTDAVGAWLPLSHEEDWEYDARVAATGVQVCKVEGIVGAYRRHGAGQLSGGPMRKGVLRHQAVARNRILEHARRAGVSRAAPEMQHFVRALFLLSRQCGAVGLERESRELFELARGEAEVPDGFDYRGYALAARVAGWRGAGVLARTLDRLRMRRA